MSNLNSKGEAKMQSKTAFELSVIFIILLALTLISVLFMPKMKKYILGIVAVGVFNTNRLLYHSANSSGKANESGNRRVTKLFIN